MKRSRVVCVLLAGVAAISAVAIPITCRKLRCDDPIDVSAANTVTIETGTAIYRVRYDAFMDGLILEGLVESKVPDLEIPAKMFYNDSLETVYEFGEGFGKENTTVKRLTVPEGIKTLSYDFFAYSGLETLNLPGSLEKLSQGVCYYASNLQNVNYHGTGVQSLSPYVFEGTPFYTSQTNEVVTFGNWLLRYNGNAEELNILELDSNIRNIGKSAFEGNQTLRKVNLNGIQRIDANAFCDCTALAEATDAFALDSVGKDAFKGTALLKKCRAEARPTHLVLGRTLIKYNCKEPVIDLGRPELDVVTNVADGAFDTCINANTLVLSPSISHLEDCLPLVDGKSRISTIRIAHNETPITWENIQTFPVFTENLGVFAKTIFMDNLMTEKSAAILKECGLTAYPLSSEQKNLSASTAYLAASRLYDYIATNYGYTTSEEGGATSFQEAFLLHPNMQCCYYASLYAYLLERAGVDAEYCISSDMTHTWNYVKIGNDWFQVDTNNASIETKSKHFMLTDEQCFNSAIYVNRNNVYWDSQYAEIFDHGLQWTATCNTLMGDLNNDHSVDELDAALLKGYLQNRSTLNVDYAYRADLNLDGVITDADLSLLKHKAK